VARRAHGLAPLDRPAAREAALAPARPGELAHYAKAAFDIQYEFPFGWQEVEGVHNRTDFDLGRHQEYSSKRLTYFDEERKEHYIPYVIETSVGCDRALLTALVDAYHEEPAGDEMRVVMRFLAEDRNRSRRRSCHSSARTGCRVRGEDHQGTDALVPRLLRRHGVGGEALPPTGRDRTPYCITVDAETLTGNTVTVRDRDTMQQERVACQRPQGVARRQGGVRLMRWRAVQGGWFVVLQRGDDVLECLRQVAREAEIRSASLTGLGAVSGDAAGVVRRAEPALRAATRSRAMSRSAPWPAISPSSTASRSRTCTR
jgi:hypothetical protein